MSVFVSETMDAADGRKIRVNADGDSSPKLERNAGPRHEEYVKSSGESSVSAQMAVPSDKQAQAGKVGDVPVDVADMSAKSQDDSGEAAAARAEKEKLSSSVNREASARADAAADVSADDKQSADDEAVSEASDRNKPSVDDKNEEKPKVEKADGAEPGDEKKPGAGKKAAKSSIKPLEINVPAEIDRYTIGDRIGSGTCGVVHKGVDKLLGRQVAIKLSPIGEAHISTGKVPGAQRAYQTELIAAGRLTHPNIVTVHDAGQHNNLNYLVMESVAGKTLKEFGKGKSPLPVGEALRIISDCCQALDYSHTQGILHRDIKPANIMLGDDGTVKLLDFGIAVGLQDDGALNRQGPTLGTPNYMSPEQILGRELGPQSDFYSLATVLFELLTGRQLFKASTVKELFRIVVHQQAPRLNRLRPDLPRGLGDLLTKALAKNPKARFRSGNEMARAIAPYIEGYRAVEQRPPVQQQLIKQLRKQAFFKPFSEVEIALLLERVSVNTYSRGETLIAESDSDRRLLVITDGVVVAIKNDQFQRVATAGDCIGETGFINGMGDGFLHSAASAVSALEFTADALAELPPKVHLHYYRHISDIMVARLAAGDKQQLDYAL
ncbi:MAG: protein kinase [Granulosicoccus sp.]